MPYLQSAFPLVQLMKLFCFHCAPPRGAGLHLLYNSPSSSRGQRLDSPLTLLLYAMCASNMRVGTSTRGCPRADGESTKPFPCVLCQVQDFVLSLLLFVIANFVSFQLPHLHSTIYIHSPSGFLHFLHFLHMASSSSSSFYVN